MLKIKMRYLKKLINVITFCSIAKTHARPWLSTCLGLRVVFRKHLSDFPPSPFALGLPASTTRLLNIVILARGISHNNKLLLFLAKKCLKHLTSHVLASTPKIDPEPLPEWIYGSDSIEKLRDNFIHKEKPVIIKNFPHAASEWNLAYFVETHGDREIIFTDSRGQHFEAPLSLLDKIKNEGLKLYVHNCSRILHKEDFELGLNQSLMQDCLGSAWSPIEIFNLFLGAFRNSGTPLHCAQHCNAFYQIEGKKKWTLIDPNYTHLVYPALSTLNAFQSSALPFPLEDRHYKDFPLAFHCPRYSSVLQPGDILLIPRWWYHSVENLSTKSVGIATRWTSNSKLEANHLYSLLRANIRFFSENLKLAIASSRPMVLLDRNYRRDLENRAFENTSHDKRQSSYTDFAAEAWSIKSTHESSKRLPY